MTNTVTNDDGCDAEEDHLRLCSILAHRSHNLVPSDSSSSLHRKPVSYPNAAMKFVKSVVLALVATASTASAFAPARKFAESVDAATHS